MANIFMYTTLLAAPPAIPVPIAGVQQLFGSRGPKTSTVHKRSFIAQFRQNRRAHKAQEHNSYTGLYKLPNELIDNITHNLNLTDILTLAKTCQRTSYLTEGRIFHEIELWEYSGRVRRDHQTRASEQQNKSLDGMEWCCMCREFHPRTSFKRHELAKAADKRECKFW
ncbi:hypothetical protein BKA63DRAFT_492596 [Paraphoma chrysanthemicola]|nr:hypothetical protein BKA63DRAFT_492596 [Paraphoma chrysanthemicola]